MWCSALFLDAESGLFGLAFLQQTTTDMACQSAVRRFVTLAVRRVVTLEARDMLVAPEL